MDERLIAAFHRTDYRVRLPGGRIASLRVDQAPPAALHSLLAGQPWGYITAWNPRSQPTPTPANRAAQRQLLQDLRAIATVRSILPGVGVGPDGWREPSLLAIGADTELMCALCLRYGQWACLVGRDRALATLLWTAPEGA